MPTSTSITTTYAGEFAGQYVGAALLSGNTLANGGLTIKPNVKYKEVLKPLALADISADASCDFTDIGTVTLTEKILEPKELQVNLELCKSDFRSDWEAIAMGYSAHDVLPKNFQDFLIARISESIAAETETNIYQGATGNSGEFDGFETLFASNAAQPAGQEIAGASVTAGNVITELGKIVDAIPSALYTKEDLYIYVSQNIARAYVRALGGFGTSGLGANGIGGQGTQWYGGEALSFDGVKLFVGNGLSDDTAFAAQKSNLYFGTGLLSDHNLVKVLDMADLDGSDNVRFVMRYTAGVQFAIGSDIVTYGITNTAN